MANFAQIVKITDNLRIVGYSNLLLPIVIAILAYIISTIEPAFDALFVALIFGILLGSLYTNEEKKRIIEKSLSVTLPIGITLYGANINFSHLRLFPTEVVALTLLLAALMGITILVLANLFNISKKLALLLACGTSICGVSAIAILSPIVKPKKHEFSAAIIIITVVGLTGAVLYPTIAYFLPLHSEAYALLTGSTLHQTGLVKIASKPFGSDVMSEALAVKGIRIAMIAVVALLASIIYSDHRFYVPWYIATFLIVALLSGMYLSEDIIDLLKPLSTIAFSITLATIGFTVNLRKVQKVRLTPLILAYVGWSTALAVFLMAIFLEVVRI